MELRIEIRCSPEGLDLVIYATTKSEQVQILHEFRETKFAVVLGAHLRQDAKDHKSWNRDRNSNRDQTEMPKIF